MDEEWKKKIVALLDGHRTMRIATNRPDGWPQTTTGGYANEGLSIYFLCGKDSQKAANLARDDRFSLTVDDDPDQVMQIRDLSMAAHARRVDDETEGARVLSLLFTRYPAQAAMEFDLPSPRDVALFELTPKVVSVLDYTLGFGHADLVVCQQQG